jgi:hypothetical protein
MDKPVNGTAGRKVHPGQNDMQIAPPVKSAPQPEQLDAVAASLRKAYSATVAEDIPQPLMDLLQQLR